MSKFPTAPAPLDIEDVQTARVAPGEIRVRIGGRWVADRPPTPADEPLLVVSVEGRRHRFTPEAGDSADEHWAASFVLPAWAEPRRAGQAALWVGEAVIPLPTVGLGQRRHGFPHALGAAVAADAPELAVADEEADVESAAPGEPTRDSNSGAPEFTDVPETPRAGPLADLLLRETVAALHAELEARGTEAAQLRSALAGAHSELESRASNQTELEDTLGQLGTELRRLMAAVDEQRREIERRDEQAERDRAEAERRDTELRNELSAAVAARDARDAELTGLRERHGSEQDAQRDQHRAELEALQAQHRAELESERALQAAELDAARAQQTGETQSLRDRLAAAEAGAQRRAHETASLREHLAAVTVARDAAVSESAGLRAELERLGTELAVVYERVQSEQGDLGQANRLLADARALAEELRTRPETG